MRVFDDLATHDFPQLADELMDTIAAGPREGDETEETERGGGGGGETKRSLAQLSTYDPREGDDTETTPQAPPRDGAALMISVVAQGPREGDETVPLEESPDTPPIHVD